MDDALCVVDIMLVRSGSARPGRRPDRRRIAELNEPMVTGESRPVAKMVGDQLSPAVEPDCRRVGLVERSER
jgi:cation transport ATPase